MTNIITNENFVNELCKVLGLKLVRRIIIDSGYPGDPITIYTESYASEKLLEIDLGKSQLDLNVVDVDDTEDEKEDRRQCTGFGFFDGEKFVQAADGEIVKDDVDPGGKK